VSKLPVLSGEELIKALLKAGFTIVRQTFSSAKARGLAHP